MKSPSTFLPHQTCFTKQFAISEVNRALQSEKGKTILILSEFHKQQRIRRLAKLTAEGHSHPAAEATVNLETFEAHFTGNRRVGRPSVKWLNETLKDAWGAVTAIDTNIPEN